MGWIKDLAAGAQDAVRDARDPLVRETKRQARIAERVARKEDSGPEEDSGADAPRRARG